MKNLTCRPQSTLSRRLVFAALVATITHFHTPCEAQEVSWREAEPVPRDGRPNPYAIAPGELEATLRAGRLHAVQYPVTVTGSLLPIRSLKKILETPTANPITLLIRSLSASITHIHSFSEAMQWLGLQKFPTNDPMIPIPKGMKPGDPMGLSIFKTKAGPAFTVSCAGCHAGSLFGKTILGLTNRFPRENRFFLLGKKVTSLGPTPLFQLATGATDLEAKLYKRTRINMQYVDGVRPQQLGLDTSLAHVALSLSHRAKDEHATKNLNDAYNPSYEPLKTVPADSKPAVWWNVKYKNRFLSDGSVLSGNPIVTNLLWNEIGRGTDLRELKNWIEKNPVVIRELTSAVFAAEAPRITDFFPAERIDLASAKRGETLFNSRCARCHGTYEKAWSAPDAISLSLAEQLRTVHVNYHEQTPVIDVGTDPMRAQGMKSLEQLNRLAISKTNGVRVVAQEGYVPPPLVGIWARWPYFHNNSAPSLCAVLTPAALRPRTYWAGPALLRDRDFDFECNGYPAQAPREWLRNKEYFYDTTREGLSNSGHDRGILVRDGKPVFTGDQRADLIQFLQTL